MKEDGQNRPVLYTLAPLVYFRPRGGHAPFLSDHSHYVCECVKQVKQHSGHFWAFLINLGFYLNFSGCVFNSSLYIIILCSFQF